MNLLPVKRILILLAVVLGLVACGTTRSSGRISVEAEVLCALYSGQSYASPAPSVFGPYVRVGLSESEVVRIFNSMTTSSQRSGISTATLHIRYIDNDTGSVLAEEDWGLLWDSSRRRFVGAPLAY